MQRGLEPVEKDRRGAIRYALFECIRDKGYAATSLGDVALGAGLSASHLLYYYPNKDAVLEDLFAVATRNMRQDLSRLPWESPAEALEALTEYFLGGRAFTRTEQGTMLQFWGLSAHYPRLLETKAAFDEDLRGRLTALFERTLPTAELSPRDAADTAYALLAGLLSATYFTNDLDLARARSLFRQALARLAGPAREEIEPAGSRRSRRQRKE